MVDVTHDGDDGVARHEVLGFVFLFNLMDGVDYILGGEVDLKTELVGDKFDGFGVETLVDADEDADGHAGGYNLGHRHVHHGCQFVGGDELRHLQHVLLLHLVHHLLLHQGVHLLALLAVVLGGLRFAHGREAGEGVANLLLNLVIVDFYGFLLVFLFLFLAGNLLLLGGQTLTLLLGFLFFLALLLGYFGTNLLYLRSADRLLLGVFAFALAAGGVGTVLGELAEVDFVEHFGTFELLVLGLDELGLRFGRFLGFGCFNRYGLGSRLGFCRRFLFHFGLVFNDG